VRVFDGASVGGMDASESVEVCGCCVFVRLWVMMDG